MTENIVQAERAGLWVGAYHFFTFCRPTLEQAEHFLAILASLERSVPMALNVEFEGNCRSHPTRDVLLREVGAWLDAVETARSKRPTISATRDAYDVYLAGSAQRAPLWIRDLESEPALPCTFWQFADDVHVRGIEGPVDNNAFVGDCAALDRL